MADDVTQMALGLLGDGAPGRLRRGVQVCARMHGLEDAQVVPAGFL